MIKASEINIGNHFLNGQNEVVTVTGVITPNIDGLLFTKVFTDKKCELYYHAEGLKPIPLDAEWLVKMGFKYFSQPIGDAGVIYEDYRLQNLVIILGNGFIEMEYVRNGFDIEERTHIINHIRYVHELQSLHYFLTGTELKIEI